MQGQSLKSIFKVGSETWWAGGHWGTWELGEKSPGGETDKEVCPKQVSFCLLRYSDGGS